MTIDPQRDEKIPAQSMSKQTTRIIFPLFTTRGQPCATNNYFFGIGLGDYHFDGARKEKPNKDSNLGCVVNARAVIFLGRKTNLGDFICVLILMCARVSMDALITVIFIRMFCCCFHRAGRRKRKRKAENGVWNCASRQPPTFIDLGTRSERIYHPSK